MPKQEVIKDILGIFTSAELREFYMKRDVDNMVKEAFLRGLKQDQVKALGEEWGKLKDDEIGVWNKVKEEFKDHVEEDKNILNLSQEEIDKKETIKNQAFKRFEEIKRVIKKREVKTATGKRKLTKADINELAFEIVDIALVFSDIELMWKTKYHDKVVKTMNYRGCSRKEAEERNLATEEYQKYKKVLSYIKNCNSYELLIKKKIGIDTQFNND